MTGERSQVTWVARDATDDDAEGIALLHLDCSSVAYADILPAGHLARMDVGAQAARWRRRIQDRRRQVAVAEVPGAGDGQATDRIVGVVSWGLSHDAPERGLSPLELASLYVAPERWGSGLGAALLELALGGSSAHLWVYEGNERAQSFYRKHGFGPDGARKVDERTGVWECRLVRR
ncbi:MAG: GNAT family N-acetyltransferase [Acidimicrobiales bacterium]